MPELRHLRRPGAIGALQLPHRIIMGAMHLGLETDGDGSALAAFYTERVRHGAGLIVTGGAAVSRVGAGGPKYAILDDPAHLGRLGKVAAEVHAAGGLIALQLFHAGRYAFRESFGLQPVAPSAVYSRFSRCEPEALSAEQIEQTLTDFASGAAWAVELGFDAVEVMASEGYLIDQFLSPVTNLRVDDWGGDALRRRRFGVEVMRRIRSRAGPDLPVIFRFSGTDLVPGGPEQGEVLDFARDLVRAGADALNVGIGWHEAPVPTVQGVVPPGVWVPVAEAVKAAAGEIPVIAGNRVNRLEQADSILAGTEIDFLSMARPFLADPALMEQGRAVNICIACNQACIDRSIVDEAVSCMVNPRAGHESDPPARPARTPQRIAVIGAGPAGLQAARELAVAGHRIELYDAADAPGGQFRMACLVPGKADYAGTIEYFAAELDRLGVTVHLGRAFGAADGELLRSYDRVVIATGVRPRRLELAGTELPHVLDYTGAFTSPDLGERIVVIGGGGIAVDFAAYASHGRSPLDPAERFRREFGLAPGTVPVTGRREVTIVHRSSRLAPIIGRSTRWVALDELRRQGVTVHSGVKYDRIDTGAVHVVNSDGIPLAIPADKVVIAVGQEPEQSVLAAVRAAGVPYRVIGGARATEGLDAVRAFAEGYGIAAALD